MLTERYEPASEGLSMAAVSRVCFKFYIGTFGGEGGGAFGSIGMSEPELSIATPTPNRAVDRRWSISPPIVKLSEGARRDSICEETLPVLSTCARNLRKSSQHISYRTR